MKIFLSLLFTATLATFIGMLGGISLMEKKFQIEERKVLALTDSYYKLKELCIKQEKYYVRRLSGR